MISRRTPPFENLNFPAPPLDNDVFRPQRVRLGDIRLVRVADIGDMTLLLLLFSRGGRFSSGEAPASPATFAALGFTFPTTFAPVKFPTKFLLTVAAFPPTAGPFLSG
jgi:hypothetical protein